MHMCMLVPEIFIGMNFHEIILILKQSKNGSSQI